MNSAPSSPEQVHQPVVGQRGAASGHQAPILAPQAPEYRGMLTRLRAAREAAGLTQAQVAAHFGRPQSFVSKVESGERRLDPIEFARFAFIYGKPVEWFLA